MTSLDDFSAFAASRGEGLHPKLRDLFERTVADPFSEVTVRSDGMLQAGPDPKPGKGWGARRGNADARNQAHG